MKYIQELNQNLLEKLCPYHRERSNIENLCQLKWVNSRRLLYYPASIFVHIKTKIINNYFHLSMCHYVWLSVSMLQSQGISSIYWIDSCFKVLYGKISKSFTCLIFRYFVVICNCYSWVFCFSIGSAAFCKDNFYYFQK